MARSSEEARLQEVDATEAQRPVVAIGEERDFSNIPLAIQLDNLVTSGSSHETVSHSIGGNYGYSAAVEVEPLSSAILSRENLSDILLQLRSIQLPSTPQLQLTASITAPALQQFTNQLQTWIGTAGRVMEWLSAGDDIEWTATGARIDLDEILKDIKQVGSLVELYCDRVRGFKDEDQTIIEILSRRQDHVITSWKRLQDALSILVQETELAHEWQEIRNSVLSEITTELDELANLIFELQESRHQSVIVAPPTDHSMPDAQNQNRRTDMTLPSEQTDRRSRLRRFILPPSPVKTTTTVTPPDSPSTESNSSLVKLVARLQPLQASIDFLPMRLASFQARASKIFPVACKELQESRVLLEKRWQSVQNDAETLRRELGEDRFILVFRNAGANAVRMMRAVESSLVKVQEVFDNAAKTSHGPGTIKLIESYEAKKMQHCPGIERVLALVDRGVQDRLTVNGEVVRLQAELQQRWQALQARMRSIDLAWDSYDDVQHRYKESRLSNFSTDEALSYVSSSPSPSRSQVSPSRSAYLAHSSPSRRQPLGLLLGGNVPKPRSAPMMSKLESGSQLSSFSPYTNAERRENQSRQRQTSPVPASKPRWNYSNVVPDPKPIYVASPMSRVDMESSSRPRSRQQAHLFSRSESPDTRMSSQARFRDRNSMFIAPPHATPSNRGSVYVDQRFSSSVNATTPQQPSRTALRSRSSMYLSSTASTNVATSTPPHPSSLLSSSSSSSSSQSRLQKRSSMFFSSSSSLLTTPPPSQNRSKYAHTILSEESVSAAPPSQNHNHNYTQVPPLLTPPPSHTKGFSFLPQSLRSKPSSSQLSSSASGGAGSGSFLPRPTFWRLGASPEDRGISVVGGGGLRG